MPDALRDVRQRVLTAFEQRYGSRPAWLVRAPGRVNLIGEHTDYNDGYVLPMAIERAVWIALRPRTDGVVRVYSLDFEQEGRFTPAALATDPSGSATAGWVAYLEGTAWALQAQGHRLEGWDGVVAGDVPLGAGLSSSAALELASLRAFAATSALDWSPAAMARLGQQAENQWVGVRCGIMDQMISAAGQRGHALLIDCRTLETRPVPLPPETVVVILDTATRRGLVDSAYNERRRQCEAAARFFAVPALRDVAPEAFHAAAAALDPLIRRRARHVVMENERTLLAAEAMAADDAVRLGQLMNASHVSLRDDFDVSSPALDLMVDLARRRAGCYGARMTGAGFGGCAVALVAAEHTAAFTHTVGRDYEEASGHKPALYISEAGAGASIEAVAAAGSVASE